MLKQWLRIILQRLFSRNESKRSSVFDQPKHFAKGVYEVDERGRVTKVRDYIRDTIGKCAMPLEEYLSRKNHLSKGSWKRPINKDHALPEALGEDDFGTTGCKQGRGFYHPLIAGRCKYCNLTPAEVKKLWEEIDRRKSA